MLVLRGGRDFSEWTAVVGLDMKLETRYDVGIHGSRFSKTLLVILQL